MLINFLRTIQFMKNVNKKNIPFKYDTVGFCISNTTRKTEGIRVKHNKQNNDQHNETQIIATKRSKN